VWFEFLISGVSRAFSHQFVRHRVGISFEQQSQRYVTYKGGRFPYVVPDSIVEAGKRELFEALMQRIGEVYEELVSAGIPAEDARFVLPNATATNLKVTVNFASLLHIADLRLCTRAQWEFRRVVAKMRAEVLRVEPMLGRMLQPKCGERRLGYCDEDLAAWEACPLGRVRPHKTTLARLYEQYRRGDVQPLRDEDFEAIERIGELAGTGG
ncbi:MAG: FAD-dependent thymidylate synthase, partial [Chloroflexota bacterium]|nr:FAD-dependent thymidylate synthase [Dehalococcoidia bacterium]MDW8047209.1 FAD-dependent thymidylate synthase [Chloroflexota bacterium]